MNRLLIGVLLPLLIGSAGWRVLHQLTASQIARTNPSPETLEQALGWNSDEPSYHFRLAIVHRDVPEVRDLDKARHHLERAIELNPYNWRYRRELAQLYELSGLTREAEQAFLKAVSLNPKSGSYRWRLANFYLRRDELEQAVPELEMALAADPRLLRPALGLLLKAGGSYAQLDRIWPDDRDARRDLLRLVCKRESLAGQALTGEPPVLAFLRQLWHSLLDDVEPLTIEQGFVFIERLVEEQLFDEARARWIELARDNGIVDQPFESKSNYVWNGDFENPSTPTFLSWQPTTEGGYTIAFADGEGLAESIALRLDFDGTQKLKYLATGPRILVEAGIGYRLALRIRYQGPRTDQGVTFEILDGPTRQVLLRTDPVLGSSGWTHVEGSFDVDPATHWVLLRMRRDPSLRVDNLFRGILWIDSLRLTQL